jgi:stage III sporulation protein AD
MILRIAVAAVIGVLLALTLKKNNPEQSFMLSVGVICVLSFLSATAIMSVMDYLRGLAEGIGLDDGVFDTLIKVLGISVIMRITSELCRDVNEQGIAAAVDVGGTVLIIYTALPLFTAVLNLVKGIL